jgi:hypothetical protein
MEMHSADDFWVRVREGEPGGEVYAKQQIAHPTIPVLSLEGPRVRRELARPAANPVTQDVPSLACARDAETSFVPHSSLARRLTVEG